MQFKQANKTLPLIILFFLLTQTQSYSTSMQVLTTKTTQLEVSVGEYIKLGNQARIVSGDVEIIEKGEESMLVKVRDRGNGARVERVGIEGLGIVNKYWGLDENVDTPVIGHSIKLMHGNGIDQYNCKQGYAGKYCLLSITAIKPNQVNLKLNLKQKQKIVVYFQQSIKLKSIPTLQRQKLQKQQKLTINYCYDKFLIKQCFPYNKNTIITKYPFYLTIQIQTQTQTQTKVQNSIGNKVQGVQSTTVSNQMNLNWSVFQQSQRSKDNPPKFSYEVVKEQQLESQQKIGDNWKNILMFGMIITVVFVISVIKIGQQCRKFNVKLIQNCNEAKDNKKPYYMYDVGSSIATIVQ